MHETILELGTDDEFEITLSDGESTTAIVTDVDESPEFYELGIDCSNGSRYILGVTKGDSPNVMFDKWDSEDEEWIPVEPPADVSN